MLEVLIALPLNRFDTLVELVLDRMQRNNKNSHGRDFGVGVRKVIGNKIEGTLSVSDVAFSIDASAAGAFRLDRLLPVVDELACAVLQ